MFLNPTVLKYHSFSLSFIKFEQNTKSDNTSLIFMSTKLRKNFFFKKEFKNTLQPGGISAQDVGT